MTMTYKTQVYGKGVLALQAYLLAIVLCKHPAKKCHIQEWQKWVLNS